MRTVTLRIKKINAVLNAESKSNQPVQMSKLV